MALVIDLGNNLMNRLWIRLTLVIAAIVLISTGTMAITARLLVNQSVRQGFLGRQLRAPGGLLDTLAYHYHETGGWAGVDLLLTGAQGASKVGPPGGLRLELRDEQGVVLFPKDSKAENASRINGRESEARRGHLRIPIEVDHKIVGHLRIRAGSDESEIVNRVRTGGPGRRGPRDPLAWFSNFLLIFAVSGAIIGLLASVLLSRSMTAPLTQLADGARSIGARKFDQRVPVMGSDEVREVATAFNEMAAGLDQAERLRRNLVADVAHELRTPLTVLQGNLRAILDDVYPLEKAEITRLYDQTRVLSRLVSDLREVAQAEAGQLELHRSPGDLNELVRNTIEGFAPVAEAGQIQLHTSLADDLPVALIDSGRIKQVLNNLVTNAIRHTPPGGEVTISSDHYDAQIRIDVRDTGQGIAADHLPYIFERFYRANEARDRSSGGSGLGLAIARAIVEAHGGSIQAASRGIGQGSTFTVLIPIS